MNKKTEGTKVTEDTTVGEVVSNFSNGVEILMGFGLHCFGCPMSQMESVGEAAQVHGVDVALMVKKLNEDLIAGIPKSQTVNHAKKPMARRIKK